MAASSCEGFSSRVDGAFDLIEDEKFDFDVPISPTEYDVREEAKNDLEDEDEVFFGPIGHKERCATVNSGLQDDDNFKPMSPLNCEQIAELFKEATAVSIFIKNSSTNKSLENDENLYSNEKENRDICNILSQTFSVEADPDQENNSKSTTESASSNESISQDSISSQQEFSDEMVIPTTPKRILQDSNSQDQLPMPLPSPFKRRKARPLTNTSKFTSSKLPQTQMTLKTRSCFNSPIKVEHLYGVLKSDSADTKDKADSNGTSPTKKRRTRASNVQGSSKGDSSFTESSKLPVPSQSGIRPPGFGVQPRRRRTSSTSSASSTSSVLSRSNSDLNETFTISKADSSSDVSSIPSACARKVPATKASLKPLNLNSAVPKPASSLNKPKGRPQPVKALPQSGNITCTSKRAPQTARSLGSTPGQKKGGVTSEQHLRKPQTPSGVQRSKSFITPKSSSTATLRKKSSVNSEQHLERPPTPSGVQRSKSFTTPKANSTARNRSSISTGQPIKSAQTPSKAKKPELQATPRKRGSATATPRNSLTTVPTPVQRRSSAVEANVTSKPGPTQVQTRSKDVHRPTTPENSVCVSKDLVTPPNPVPTKVVKKSLSANGQKRRSFLPTPLRSDRITRSQSQKSKSSTTDYAAQGALPFNISPSAEIAKPKTATTSGSQDGLNLEPSSQSSSRLSDPFSPLSQSITIDPVQDNMDGDSVVRNLIELSPTLPMEGTLIDI